MSVSPLSTGSGPSRVNLTRDKGLADVLMQQVCRSAQTLRPLLVLTDGWVAYPGSMRRAFREKVKKMTGVGRAGIVNLCTSPDELSPLRGFFGLFQADSSRKEAEKTCLFPTFQEN